MAMLMLLVGSAMATEPVVVPNISSWVDPTTPAFDYERKLPGFPPMTLVFSEEFNATWLSNRSWTPSQTMPKGEANRKWSATYQLNSDTYGETFLHPEMISASDGKLHLAAQHQEFGGAGYLGAQLTTWNKFCFQGGYMEVRALRGGAQQHALAHSWCCCGCCCGCCGCCC